MGWNCNLKYEGKETFMTHACYSGLKYNKVNYLDIKIWKDTPFFNQHKHIRRIVRLVNKIQKCEYLGDNVIRYHVIGTYNKDLVLLSFFRQCWQTCKSVKGNAIHYFCSEKYFEAVDKYTMVKDPLQRLFYFTDEASDSVESRHGYGNHSNTRKPGKRGAITTELFNKWDGDCRTIDFREQLKT